MKNIFPVTLLLACIIALSGTIDLNNLPNYAGQTIPTYITKDNTPVSNPITDKGATLGRVLFYDKNLSVNNTVACGSCHRQEAAFSDTAVQSTGRIGGVTVRHGMRLINARFSNEVKFFWDERATSLEDQTTHPIQDHTEMGFSGSNGDPDLDSLIRKMNSIGYYNKLFKFVYGDSIITESRIQNALAQFVRSIQSFDSKYDVGRTQTGSDGPPFANFTVQENDGKHLFLTPPPQGGAGCQGCHQSPEFDIDPNSGNNGIIGVAGSTTDKDTTVTRAPSLRNLFNLSGNLNSRLMHTGFFTDILTVINHYNSIPLASVNGNLDPKLLPGGNPQLLNLDATQKNAIIAFLKTLTGTDVYTNQKWSNPFDSNGNLDLIDVTTGINTVDKINMNLYPNPADDYLQINLPDGNYSLKIFTASGQLLQSKTINGNYKETLDGYGKGLLIFEVEDKSNNAMSRKKIIKN